MYDGYQGLITEKVYTKALKLRGDDTTCWEEKVRLARPPLIIPSFPESLDGDLVIKIWEMALAQTREEMGDERFLKSVTVYLEEDPDQPSSPYGIIVWEKNVPK